MTSMRSKDESDKALKETLYLTSNNKLTKKIKDGEKEDISKMKTYNPKENF